MSEKSDPTGISSVTGLFAIPVPIVMTAHVRAESEEEALRIARDAFDGMQFEMRDGIEIHGIPVSAAERARLLPDVSISPHVFGSDVKHIQYGKNLTEEEIIQHGQKDDRQAEMSFPFPGQPGVTPKMGTAWGAIYCIGDAKSFEDNIPVVASSNTTCLFLLGTVLVNLSHDNGVTVSPEMANMVRSLSRQSVAGESVSQAGMDAAWEIFERQASIMRYNEITFSLCQQPAGDIPVMKEDRNESGVSAAMILKEKGQSTIVGIGNNHISAQVAGQNRGTDVVRAYTSGLREDAAIMKNAQTISYSAPVQNTPRQPSFGM